MLTSQMGIVAQNRGVHMEMAFLWPKITIVATVWTRLYSYPEKVEKRNSWLSRNTLVNFILVVQFIPKATHIKEQLMFSQVRSIYLPSLNGFFKNIWIKI